MSYHSWVALLISVVFTTILGPIFMGIMEAIQSDIENENKLTYNISNQYKWMFDSIQEGIIVVSQD
jgi:heme/copper-type cytochrome/quinol oxidase subunit 2